MPSGKYNTQQLIELVKAYARKWGIDERIAVAQIALESGNFDPKVVYGGRKSSAGAEGIAQFIPGTAARYQLKNPYDPDQALNAWGWYMSDLLKLFNGRYDLALAGYNWGEGSRAKGNRPSLYNALDSNRPVTDFRLPSETRNYVTDIINAAKGALGITSGGAGASRYNPQPIKPLDPAMKKNVVLLVAGILILFAVVRLSL